MNINDLTIGQAKELSNMENLLPVKELTTSLLDSVIGKYVIVRSRNEGINAGVVVRADETGIILKDARRIYYHRPADKKLSWYEGVAVSGLSDNSKISGEVKEKGILEDYSYTLCSDVAEKSIRGHRANEQS